MVPFKIFTMTYHDHDLRNVFCSPQCGLVPSQQASSMPRAKRSSNPMNTTQIYTATSSYKQLQFATIFKAGLGAGNMILSYFIICYLYTEYRILTCRTHTLKVSKLSLRLLVVSDTFRTHRVKPVWWTQGTFDSNICFNRFSLFK